MSGRLKWTFLFRRFILSVLRYMTVFLWKKFEYNLKNPKKSQNKVLNKLLKATHPRISLKNFENISISNYYDFSKRILEAKATGKNFLTRVPPVFYEPTSGSSTQSKLIPYTSALLHSFTHLFLLWVHDILWYGPHLQGGRIYFSISPQFHDTGEGLPDDSAYLTGPVGFLFRLFIVVPPDIKKLLDPQNFYYILSLYLLAAEDLEVISIWSPGFLTALLRYIQEHRIQLAEAGQNAIHQVENITFYTGCISEQVKVELLKPGTLQWTNIFPCLRLISCWGAQNSAVGFQHLRQIFSGVYVQEKGLLATEAPVSFPSERYGQFLPVLDQVYFEFLSEDGHLLRLDQLEVNQSYELIITQQSGLLRYRIGDYIRVRAKIYQTPCFEFVGRARTISDLVGEKLSENWLAHMLKEKWSGIYLCLIPDIKNARYYLFSDAPVDMNSFEAELMHSPHYRNARLLNQLNPLKGYVIADLAEQIKNFFCEYRQMKRGDIKEQWLYSRELDGTLFNFLRAKAEDISQ